MASPRSGPEVRVRVSVRARVRVRVRVRARARARARVRGLAGCLRAWSPWWSLSWCARPWVRVRARARARFRARARARARARVRGPVGAGARANPACYRTTHLLLDTYLAQQPRCLPTSPYISLYLPTLPYI